MTWLRIGVLRPGAVGAAVATVLHGHGLRTVIGQEGRSAHSVNVRATLAARQAASCICVSCSAPFAPRA
jgi:hypothetical protein